MSLFPRLDFDKGADRCGSRTGLRERETGKKAGVVGYCFGGTMAWLAATRLNPAVAVGYYGGRIVNFAAETPKAPVMLHFGKLDTHIPAEGIEKLQAAYPEVEIYWYDAGHGFNCDARASYNERRQQKARGRSLAFLKKHLVQKHKNANQEQAEIFQALQSRPGKLPIVCSRRRPFYSDHTASTFPTPSEKWKRRPPGNSKVGTTMLPPAATIAASVAFKSAE